MHDIDVLVIGGGAMGLATAWQLARRGVAVRLVEQYAPGHHEGASHGACRNFNPAYLEPELIALFREAHDLWRELEAETDTQLLDLVGLVTHGRTPLIRRVAEAIGPAGIRAELLDAGAADARWPAIRFDGDVLFTPDAGRIRAADALRALATAAADAGAQLSWNTRAVRVEPDDDGVTVHVEPWGAEVASQAGVALAGESAEADADAGADVAAPVPAGPERIRARVVVSATGAWTSKLLGAQLALPRLTVTQETPVHFPVFDASLDWPSFNHAPGPGSADYWRSTIYGMLTPGEGVKAGWHRVGPQIDPDGRTFRGLAEQTAALQDYARDWLPGVDASVAEEISCTYTSADDGVFVMDRFERVVVLAGFAGEGFKFVPAVGRVGADLACEALGHASGAGASAGGERMGAAPFFSAARPRVPNAEGQVLGAFTRRD